MNRNLLSIVVLTIAALGEAAWGHGIPLSISADGTNRLFSTPSVSYNDHESEIAPFPTSMPVVLRGAAGFYPAFGVIPGGTQLSFDVSGSSQHVEALLYWDGNSILPSPVSIQVMRTGITVDVAPSDTFLPGGTLPPYNGQPGGHSSVNLNLPLNAPIGLYGIGFQVTSPGYSRSETFWAIGNNGMEDPDDVSRGLAAIHASLPEPSGLALAACGASLLTSFRRRRKESRSGSNDQRSYAFQ
jgi:hypothetical protein